MTAAQKNAKAMKLLKRMFNDLGPMAPKSEIVAEVAAFVGDKRISRGTVEVSILNPEGRIPFDNLQEDDKFTAELVVTNSRTGRSSSVGLRGG